MSNERSRARDRMKSRSPTTSSSMAARSVSSRSGCGVPPPRERKDLKRRPIILRARPSGEIERSVRIDAGFRQHRVAEDRRDLVVGPHILQEGGLNLLPETPLAKKLAPVQIAQRSAEIDKLAQTLDGDLPLEPLGLRHAQRVDDDRRIPEPVKEIVGVGIVSGEEPARPPPIPAAERRADQNRDAP